MVRYAVTILCACALVLSLGCGSGGSGGSDKPNPNNLPYSKEGPPKRGNIPPPKG